MVHYKDVALPLAVQKLNIINTFNNVKTCDIKHSTLTCVIKIKPSENSEWYTVKIAYNLNSCPKVWLLAPELQKRDSHLPPHLYPSDNRYPQLCIYYGRYNEWSKQKLLSNTFIPWISTWLNTYEFWLLTGEWHYAQSPHSRNK